MTKTDYAGIDYSLGKSNVDDQGIHYGVINQNQVLQSWSDTSEPYYGSPHCPKCNSELDKDILDDHTCECGYTIKWIGEECYGDASSYYVDDEEYSAECSDDGDIFISKSPYYTHAQFCSPCAPGAGYLANPCDDGPKTYCFHQEWFDDSIEACPYAVYRIDTDECIYTPAK